MIYARFGDPATILRYASADDVRQLDPPLDDEAKVNLWNKSWVVIEVAGKQDAAGPLTMISHLAYLRADEGIVEIMKALEFKDLDCVFCGERLHGDERCLKPRCVWAKESARKRLAKKRS